MTCTSHVARVKCRVGELYTYSFLNFPSEPLILFPQNIDLLQRADVLVSFQFFLDYRMDPFLGICLVNLVKSH